MLNKVQYQFVLRFLTTKVTWSTFKVTLVYMAVWRCFHGRLLFMSFFLGPAEEYWQLKDSLNQQAVDSDVGIVALEMEAFNL